MTQTPIAQAVLTKAVHLNVYPAQLGNRVRARGRRQRLLASCAQQAHSGTLQAPQPAPCVRLGRPTTSLGLTRPSIALNARLERTRQGLAPRPVSNVLPASTAQSSALASRLCACLAPRRLPLAPAAPACTTVRVTQDMQGSWAGLAQHVRQGFTNQEWASKIALSASLAHTVIQTLRRLITTSKASRLCACGRSSRARRAALRVLRIASP